MFEIEKNFILTKEQEDNLIKDSEFIGQKVFTDIYYDKENYDLTKKDIWFRARDGKFELKLPLVNNEAGDRYEEVDDEDHIKEVLNIKGESLKESLGKYGYIPFCVCKTTRKKYKQGDFNIDVDSAEFDNGFRYSISEIELMIDDDKKANEAAEKIINFAKNYGLRSVKNGKIIEYLKIYRPNQFKVLSDLGIFQK
ncbi:MAG: CYTH domain-containing protein [Patescibacteria group bacterium]